MAQRTKPTPEDATRLALEALPDGVVLIASDGHVTACNREAGAIAGIDPALVTGQPAQRLYQASALNWLPVAEMIEAGRTGDVMLRSDRVGTVLVTLRRIADRPGAVVVVLRDLAVIDHARRLASGQRDTAVASAPERRLRPDFARQRQISPTLDRILSRGERALTQGARVIITGESGTGKTEAARHLHQFVSAATDPFVAVNCAAIPESLFESELFGYERGAFTGALQEGKKGLIEAAEGGTLFLDEVGEIPLTMQAKLLSFLEDGMILRVGGTRARRVNVRVISATNRNLLELAQERRFRLDLYYRLAVVEMPMRPLSGMPELIEHLAERFLLAINQRRTQPMELSPQLMARLRGYDWPGNIRELWNLLQQISVLGEDEDELPPRLGMAAPLPGADPPPDTDRPLRDMVADYERQVIETAIRSHGSKRKAAKALGVDIGTIVRKTNRKEP